MTLRKLLSVRVSSAATLAAYVVASGRAAGLSLLPPCGGAQPCHKNSSAARVPIIPPGGCCNSVELSAATTV